MKIEYWRPIPGYEGLYMVSNLGKVKSVSRWAKSKGSGKRFVKERLLKLDLGQDKRYFTVNLSKNGKVKHFYLHLLVWEAFNGPIPEGMVVNHIDENPKNCCLDNLMLCTQKENCNWGDRNNKISQKLKNSICSKPVLQFSLDGIMIKKYPSLKEAYRETGIFFTNISACCSGRGKTAGGYIWKYA